MQNFSFSHPHLAILFLVLYHDHLFSTSWSPFQTKRTQPCTYKIYILSCSMKTNCYVFRRMIRNALLSYWHALKFCIPLVSSVWWHNLFNKYLLRLFRGQTCVKVCFSLSLGFESTMFFVMMKQCVSRFSIWGIHQQVTGTGF